MIYIKIPDEILIVNIIPHFKSNEKVYIDQTNFQLFREFDLIIVK